MQGVLLIRGVYPSAPAWPSHPTWPGLFTCVSKHNFKPQETMLVNSKISINPAKSGQFTVGTALEKWPD